MNSTFGYVRVGLAVPVVEVAAVSRNVAALTALARQAADAGCDVVVFPELCLTGYTCADLFQQSTLLQAAETGLAQFLTATAKLPALLLVGLPVRCGGKLYNAAAVCHRGRLLGVVPKQFIPNYREYYEQRWFAAGATLTGGGTVTLAGQTAPCGGDLIFAAAGQPAFCVAVEICEDLWAPLPPSTLAALRGATLLCNLSASNELVGKAGYRRQLVAQQSARCLAAYAYASAGVGESSTDLVFGGHALLAENGSVLAESARFEREPALTVADVDLAFLQHERLQNSSFQPPPPGAEAARVIAFTPQLKSPKGLLRRPLPPQPFVPAAVAERAERCEEIFAIQSSGLATRLRHCAARNVVIGLSGGLDSTLALLVTVEAFRACGLPLSGIHGITMPGFGTSQRTLRNVRALCRGLQVGLTTIDIRASCKQHFRDLGHDGKTGDLAFENVQARERTQVLMDKANMIGGLVIGTGDLSELALGWCTYNGDHMSMYGVNAGVPKTLARYLVEWVADHKSTPAVARTLRDVLATPVSPELLPLTANGEIAQCTESVIGPYELHDFFLYEMVRRGSRPDKILWLASQAFSGRYPEPEIRRWLELFVRRFFTQQFKRSCLPDGPKVGSVALSPRGDWRMPSDACAEEWLACLPPAPAVSSHR